MVDEHVETSKNEEEIEGLRYDDQHLIKRNWFRYVRKKLKLNTALTIDPLYDLSTDSFMIIMLL